MSKIFIETDTLTGIANAIRSKTGDTQPISTTEMATQIEGITTGGNVAELTITSNGTYRAPEGIDGYTPVVVNVPQDGAPPAEAFVITGTGRYSFSYNNWNWFINQYSNQITTKDIGADASYMFSDCDKLTLIPFEINCGNKTRFSYMFNGCSYLSSIPKMSGQPEDMDNMFYSCYRLKEIPEDFDTWFDWSYIDNSTSSYLGNMSSMFQSCYGLRKLPIKIFEHSNPVVNYTYNYFSSLASSCYSLDEILDMPISFNTTYTTNIFRNSFDYTTRLKNMTFKMPNGAPYTVNWKSQTIDLSKNVGYGTSNLKQYYINYAGLTTDTEIWTDASYQALKDNPDSWTIDINYSRYNHDSAVATINSLPDASAYLATAGGTNTIKFKGASGALTDGGAINTLTEEEIAVATSRGWTVSFV